VRTLHIDLRDGFNQDDVIFHVNNQEVSRRTGVTTNLTISHAAVLDILVPEGRCALRLDIPKQNISASIDVDAVAPLCGDLRAPRHSGVSHAEGSDDHALIFTNLGRAQRGKEIRMSLDDIPKVNCVGEESGSVPAATERITRFSTVCLPVRPSRNSQRHRHTGHYVHTAQVRLKRPTTRFSTGIRN